jgi:transposase
MTTHTPYAAYLGIDWADRKHDICLREAGSAKLEFSVLSHTPEAIHAWAVKLRERFHGAPLAVCIESRTTPLIYALLQFDCFVIIPVHPQTLARYRNALHPSHAKDDPTDAQLLADLVQRHPEQFAPWIPDRPELRALRQLVEIRRHLVEERVRCTNRITATLKCYYPQALDWIEETGSLLFCELVTRWPTLRSIQAASDKDLRDFFHAHNGRSHTRIEERIRAIRSAIPLTEDPGVVEPNQLWVAATIAQMRVLIAHIHQIEDEIEQRFSAMPDAELFAKLPGAGRNLAPRLLVALGEDRNRFATTEDLLAFAGIAPVTERSGTKSWVHWRFACATFVRQSFVEWARESTRFSYWAHAYYQQLRERGKSHQMATRALAFKWIRILYRCWQNKTPYNEATYLLALEKKGSPLVHQAAK